MSVKKAKTSYETRILDRGYRMLPIRLTIEEYAQVKKAADAEDRPVAWYARRATLEAAEGNGKNHRK